MITQLIPKDISTSLAKTMTNPLDHTLDKKVAGDEYNGIVNDVNVDIKRAIQSMVWDLTHNLIRTSLSEKITQLKKEG